ncbi:MAG: RagB/SusD family nutrient uptake outer membrane protein [Candidatus Azobacteroides sp.]|nr:RagB/SusD family nutrient uptake outer membrane protein [Candidatus Azobacteroides sp.]
MKQLYKISALFISMVCLFCACEDFLNTNSKSQLNETTMYNTEGDIYRAVLGIYSAIMVDGVYGLDIPFIFCYSSDIEYGECNAAVDNSRRGIWDYSVSSDNDEIGRAWGPIYSAVNTANECIEGIEKSDLFAESSPEVPSVVRQLYGEAKAMRAMLYLDLVRNWGDVPFLTKGTKAGDDFYQGVTNRNEILSWLINDLIDAEPAMFYASEISQSIERFNRGAVQGFIARMSLARGGYSLYPDYNNPSAPGEMKRPDDYLEYYRIANTYARKLQTSGKHGLLSSFAQVFVNECQEIYPSGDDVLFEIPFATSYNGNTGVIVGHRVNQSKNNPYGWSSGWYYATITYHASFDYSDIRRDVTCAPYSWSWNAEKGRMEQVFSEWRSIYIGKWNRLWMKIQQGPDAQYSTGINFPVIRYADVLLMLAETENELNNGPTDDARNALKEVRLRAFPENVQHIKVEKYVNDLVTYGEFFHAVQNERAWEFGGEAIRKYDLIRWNRMGNIRQMKIDVSNMSGDAGYPKYVYTKTKDDGTLDILNFDNTMAAALAGYTRRDWAVGTATGGFTTYDKSFKDEYINPEPMVYIFPLYKDVITDSRGALKNYYGKK